MLLGYDDASPLCVLQMASPEEKCQQVLEPPYDEMVAAHLRWGALVVPLLIIDCDVLRSDGNTAVCVTGVPMRCPITTS